MKIIAVIVMLLLAVDNAAAKSAEKETMRVTLVNAVGHIKAEYQIVLPRRITKSHIKGIAQYLRLENIQYRDLYICYYHPSYSPAQQRGCWATANWRRSSLNLYIAGLTAGQAKQVRALKGTLIAPKGATVLGRWFSDGGRLSGPVMIYRIGKHYYQLEKHMQWPQGKPQSWTTSDEMWGQRSAKGLELHPSGSVRYLISKNGKLKGWEYGKSINFITR